VFDYAEKVDDFSENNAPMRAIIFDYYFNFIPYFANLFTPLFAFISVKQAAQSIAEAMKKRFSQPKNWVEGDLPRSCALLLTTSYQQVKK